ncbi:MAG: glycerol-3-phosphate 1-O-acyltransferase PlsY [Bacillota bacterium]|nr:glycerol-3-phosphate 1-O-acyltransferase PlsY [Bacillota bacterium]
MILVLKVIAVAVVGYLLGSINSSLVVGKFYGVDVRQHGSGNAGANNTLRTLGKKAAVLVTAGDILKGVAACIIGHYIVGTVNGLDKFGLIVGGISAIIGHNWPLYFGFRGGKGVLTTFSVILMMDWQVGLILLGAFIIVVVITGYVSLGSIIGASLFPIVSAVPLFNNKSTFVLFAIVVAFLVIIRHKSNIERIFKGTESKFGKKNNK